MKFYMTFWDLGERQTAIEDEVETVGEMLATVQAVRDEIGNHAYKVHISEKGGISTTLAYHNDNLRLISTNA